VAIRDLRECWGAVHATATALLACGELTGEEATAISVAEIPDWRLRLSA
jgi:hypothetical protein